jgi:hypothetical protein
MSDFIPQHPDNLESFEVILAEYNKMQNTELQFFFDEHPSDVDFMVNNEYTADSYDVWVMRDVNEAICLSENVYYNEPSGDDLLNQLDYMIDDCKIYCELEASEIEYTLKERLYTNYYNYKQELEDEKVK